MRIAVTALSVCIAICINAFGADEGASKLVPAWKPPFFSKVVAYRFEIPSADEGVGRFTFLRRQKLDSNLLAAQERQKATLSEKQISRLFSALVPKQQYGFVACYTPHHIFVFYSAASEPVAAIEVCFECRAVQALPTLPDTASRRQDLAALARLIDELGLWSGKKTAKQWIGDHEADMRE